MNGPNDLAPYVPRVHLETFQTPPRPNGDSFDPIFFHGELGGSSDKPRGPAVVWDQGKMFPGTDLRV